MPSCPEGSRGDEHDAPLPTGEPSHGPSSDERDAEPTGRHLYLIFDDWPWGYSVRKIKLPPPRSPHQRSLRPLEHRSLRRPQHKRLPPPCIRLEALRSQSSFFAAVGTNIIVPHPRHSFPVNQRLLRCRILMPIVDVCSLGVRFGPVLPCLSMPLSIMITAGDEQVFALDLNNNFSMLSMKPLFGPRYEWSWCDLPPPPPSFKSSDGVNSVAVDSDGWTIFASTHSATFAFDIINSKWKQSSNCSLPFNGPAYYVHALDIFVGISNNLDTYGHLCFCRKLGGGDENFSFSKENLLTVDPPGSHIGAKLLYLGGSEPGFCLVECCASITLGKSVDFLPEEWDQLVGEGGGHCDLLNKKLDELAERGELDELYKQFEDEWDGVPGSMRDRYHYRLTTFSLSFDNNGDLTTGDTCVVQCYKVPEQVTKMIFHANPVAFWL